ncbi:DUF4446 family protein [candidate division WWE3 bacterium]|nr:DUF4446 family protein [candidate division WWE3 bacterium]
MDGITLGAFFASNIGILFIILFVIGFIWLGVLTFFVYKSHRYSTSLFGETGKENLREILNDHINRVEGVKVKIIDFEKIVTDVQKNGMNHFAKMSIIRFNPYNDTGGDQSFVLALLDERNNGVVISSMHGRQQTRMYAKPIVAGESSDYELSDEEKEAIRKALSLGYK